jgi:hypothetical protein
MESGCPGTSTQPVSFVYQAVLHVRIKAQLASLHIFELPV